MEEGGELHFSYFLRILILNLYKYWNKSNFCVGMFFVLLIHLYMPQVVCNQCQSLFFVTEEDQTFYIKMEVPVPSLCPECRLQRRLAFISNRLFWATCAKTGKKFLSQFDESIIQCPLYSGEAYWSDDWDALEYGRDFDFSRSFFDQFHDLMRVAPRSGNNNKENVNSDYTMNGHKNQNCYLINNSDFNRSCLFGYWVQNSVDCADSDYIDACELCYEVTDSRGCFDLQYSRNSANCSESKFLFDCIACKNCLFCSNQRQKQYCIFNQQLTEEEYKARLKEFDFQDRSKVRQYKFQFQEWLMKQIQRASFQVQCENSTGCYLEGCSDCHDSFQIRDCKKCNYCTEMYGSHDCYDTHVYNGELLYNCSYVGPDSYRVICSNLCWTLSDAYYCIDTHYSQNVFGCIGLKKKKYCILNKQYSKEAYEELLPKILSHMKLTGELGEFPPLELSPFAYNHTCAQEYFPLSTGQVLDRKGKWKEELASEYAQSSFLSPNHFSEMNPEICIGILACANTKKNFKIVKPEYELYQKLKVPAPDLCPEERFRIRKISRAPWKLWERKCAKCQMEMKTTYSTERREIVYCEKCYLSSVY